MKTEAQIKARLVELGYDGNTDLAATIRQFQKDVAMADATGIVDQMTVDVLFSDAAPGLVAEVYPNGRGL